MNSEDSQQEDAKANVRNTAYRRAYRQGYEEGRHIATRGTALSLLIQRFKTVPMEVMAAVYYAELATVEALLPCITVCPLEEIKDRLGEWRLPHTLSMDLEPWTE